MSSCIDPQPMVNPKTGKRMFVACGKCASCLESRRQQWKFRLMKELKYSSTATHLTLTYNEDNIEDNVLNKKHLVNYFKTLRNRGLVFRYYAIGEYGTTDKRRHFHVLLFVKNLTNSEFPILRYVCEASWKYGFVYFKQVHVDTLGYVLHYHVRPKIVDNKPTVQLYSKGLGSEWFDDPDIHNFVVNSKSVRLQGDDAQFYNLPRYYRKKYGMEFEQSEVCRKPEFHKQVERIYKKPYFECTKSELIRVGIAFVRESSRKIAKYNNQDKL